MARRRGQQRGYLHKQGNGWYLAYREDALDADGKLVRIRRNPKIADAKEVSKREARRIADEHLASINLQAQQPYSLLTVEQFVDNRFVPDVVWSRKHSGRKHYDHILRKHVLPAIGGMKLREVLNDHVQELVRRKLEAGYSTQMAVHIRNTISAVFNHAKLKRAYQGDNPAQGVRMPEMKRKETRALSFDQARGLCAILPRPVREMTLLSLLTSLNVAEMLGLRWGRVNLSDRPMVSGAEILAPRTLAVRENYYRGEFGSVKAKSRRRVVPLGPAVVAALSALRDACPGAGAADLVFSTAEGKPLNEGNLCQRVLKPAGKRLGMPWLSWHVFRHTHATFGEEIGMPLSDRQAQMGHGDVRMTLHYTHSDLERRRKSIEAMETELLDPKAA